MTLPASTRRDAATLSARLPSLVIAARRVAQTVRHGVHGRRRAGSGETFWQFRPFLSGEPSSRVDWRRSAREERAFVREREWEAAHTVWIWFDRSASMQFASSSGASLEDGPGGFAGVGFRGSLCPRGRACRSARPYATIGDARRRRALRRSDCDRRATPRARASGIAAPAARRATLDGSHDRRFFLGARRRRACGPGCELGGRDRRTGDDRRSDRGDLSVLRQHRVSPSRWFPERAHPAGAKLARRLSRAPICPPRNDPWDLRQVRVGNEHPSD